MRHITAAWVDAQGAAVRCAEGTTHLAGPFQWTISEGVACIGPGEGPCPDGVVGVPQCRACFGPDRPECIFEPACAADPSHCGCTFGPIEHVVYLAFYGILPKVGMTQARRVERRLQEQGADAYMVLAHLDDRASARRLEKEVGRSYGIPEWRAHTETLPQLARPVPWDAIAQRAAVWATRLDGGLSGRLVAGPPRRLSHPLDQPLPGRPTRRPTAGAHAGEWLGAKGPHAIYAEAARDDRLQVGARPLAALALPDLVGRFIAAAAPPQPAR